MTTDREIAIKPQFWYKRGIVKKEIPKGDESWKSEQNSKSR